MFLAFSTTTRTWRHPLTIYSCKMAPTRTPQTSVARSSCSDNWLIVIPTLSTSTYRLNCASVANRNKIAHVLKMMGCRGFCGTVGEYQEYIFLRDVMADAHPATLSQATCSTFRHGTGGECRVCFASLPPSDIVTGLCRGTHCENHAFEFNPFKMPM